MKTLLTTGALCAVIGAVAGWLNAADHYKTKARSLEIAAMQAGQKRDEAIEGAISEYYKLYKAAADSEPITVTERVYIKANCSAVQTDTGSGMDDGANAARVEIDTGVVRGIIAVAEKHKKEYEKCSATLRAFQSLIELQ